MPLLSVAGLHVAVEGKEIIHGLTFSINTGEVHAIMGPNGSGKSTLVNVLMGHPRYQITSGTVAFHGKDLLAMEAHERARAGLFLAFQYPKEIAGVSLRSFLFAAYKAQVAVRDSLVKIASPITFKSLLEKKMKLLNMDPAFMERSLNQGFSGGEKKKAEVLQMHILQPNLALLDETDSGLDVDALRTVGEGVNALRNSRPGLPAGQAGTRDAGFSALIVTHYARILGYVKPDRVHVMVGGKIVESGGVALAIRLEKEGYARFGTAASDRRVKNVL